MIQYCTRFIIVNISICGQTGNVYELCNPYYPIPIKLVAELQICLPQKYK